MFTVWFARGYTNQEQIAVCKHEQTARLVADAEFENGTHDITVEDQFGATVYEPEYQPILIDEL